MERMSLLTTSRTKWKRVSICFVFGNLSVLVAFMSEHIFAGNNIGVWGCLDNLPGAQLFNLFKFGLYSRTPFVSILSIQGFFQRSRFSSCPSSESVFFSYTSKE